MRTENQYNADSHPCSDDPLLNSEQQSVRAVEQIVSEWLRKNETSISSSSSPSSDTTEAVKRYIIEEMERIEEETDKVNKENQVIEKTIKIWENAGICEFLNSLNDESIKESNKLAKAYALLNISPIRDDDENIIDNTMKLIDKLSLLDLQYKKQHNSLENKRNIDLPNVIEQLKHSKDLLSSTQNDMHSKENMKQNMKQNIEMIHSESNQYQTDTSNILREVRSRGLEIGATHDAVVNDIHRLTDLENQLSGVNKALIEFHDLPPKMDECHQIISDLDEQVQSENDKLQNALSSIVKKR